MKKQKGFFKIVERVNGDKFWNRFSVEKSGGNALKTIEDDYNLSVDLQNVFTNTSNIPLKKLNDKDRDKYYNILESLNFKNYKPTCVETKPARNK